MKSASRIIGSEVKDIDGVYLGNIEELIINDDIIELYIISLDTLPHKLIPLPPLLITPDNETHSCSEYIIDIADLHSSPSFDVGSWPEINGTYIENIYSYYCLEYGGDE